MSRQSVPKPIFREINVSAYLKVIGTVKLYLLKQPTIPVVVLISPFSVVVGLTGVKWIHFQLHFKSPDTVTIHVVPELQAPVMAVRDFKSIWHEPGSLSFHSWWRRFDVHVVT